MHNNCYSCNDYTTTRPYNAAQPGSGSSSDCTCYLAIANVPWQYFTNSYAPDRAFQTGTVFPELDKPFLGRGVKS